MAPSRLHKTLECLWYLKNKDGIFYKVTTSLTEESGKFEEN